MSVVTLVPFPEDRGDAWLQTFTGKQMFPLDPRPEDVCIEDIAHALAMKCRYGGHCGNFYSVAEHSVLVSRAVPAEHRLAALLHDAAEAYIADVPRPIKPRLSGYRFIEERLEQVIADVFGLPPPPWAEAVKEADTRILLDEKRVLLGEPPADWGIDVEPLGISIHMWPWWYAERVFLSEFKRLTA